MRTQSETASARTANQHDLVSFDRRHAMAMIGAGAATFGGLAAMAQAQQGSPQRQDPHMPRENVGFDPKSGQYILPPLPYPQDALEPHIDAQTMQLHHNKHHAGYVKGLNDALAALAEIRSGKRDKEELSRWQNELAFHGSGHFLHTIFWNSMSPQGGGAPSGTLAEQIEKDFGSFRSFTEHFTRAANSVKGSGWSLLVYEPIADRLLVMQVEQHHLNTIWGVVPFMGVDVWEHAYYLKYQNRRGEYTDAFMKVANWDFVSRELEGTKKLLAPGRPQ
jgi:Fe-Mn family superoxide dismutase